MNSGDNAKDCATVINSRFNSTLGARSHSVAEMGRTSSRQKTVDKRPSFSRLFSVITGGHGDLALFEDDTKTMPSLATYLLSLSGLGANDNASNGEHGGKTKLGTMFGVYLPSIQHILGVQMFLRLLWITGISGLSETIVMLFVCCLCTFLTSISISAVATNGKIESGGAYFMISRNLGPEFGGAIGILFYLANTVATAMYLVGGVEVLLMYIAPGLPQFGSHASNGEEHDEGQLFNDFRIYGTVFLLLVFAVCAMGVRFVQFFAPVSLAAVLLSIAAVVVGAIVANPRNSPMICILGDRLLEPNAYMDPFNETADCNKTEGGALWHQYCETNGTYAKCDPFYEENDAFYIPGIPGFSSGVIKRNAWSSYMEQGQVTPGHNGKVHREIVQDITTNWFVLLAIFFPSVTGIMTGANMSGDLKDPQRSLPIGTLAAQLTTSLIYLILVICYAGTMEGVLLRDKYGGSVSGSMVVASLAWPNEWVLLIGSFLACIGAGLQCLCSAPRLLQSIAKDNIIPCLSVFSVVTKRNEPFRALLLSAVIAECGVLIGGIDYIAPVVDFFFLMSYCFVNIVCTLQTLLQAPNWRPRFRYFHWSLSMLGALLCLFIMFATYWYYAIVVIILCVGLYKYIEYKGAKQEWGDGIRGLALSTAQYSLMKIEGTELHPKNWRPQLLVVIKHKIDEGPNRENQKLLNLAGSLKAGRGLTMVADLVEGDISEKADRERASAAATTIRRMMKEAKVKGFVEEVVVRSASENVATVLQCVGMGALRPNTVVVGWPRGWKDDEGKNEEELCFFDAIQRAASADMCLLVVKGVQIYPEIADQLSGTIDVWWIIHDGGLLILLPFLLRKHRIWRGCKLRVFAVAQASDNSAIMKQELQNWVYQLRIDCTVDVVELAESTISAYTAEKTLIMEERSRLARSLRMTVRSVSKEPQMVADKARHGELVQTRKASLSASLASIGSPKKALNHNDDTNPASSRRGSSQSDGSVTDDAKLKYTANPRSCANKLRGAGTTNPIFDALDEIDETTHANNNDEPSDANETAKGVTEVNIEGQKGSIGGIEGASHHGSTVSEEPFKPTNIDKSRQRKMNTAVKLNRVIKEKSRNSRLVVMNLPKPPNGREDLRNHMEYLEVMTNGLGRVLLVRGSGKEVVTIYS